MTSVSNLSSAPPQAFPFDAVLEKRDKSTAPLLPNILSYISLGEAFQLGATSIKNLALLKNCTKLNNRKVVGTAKITSTINQNLHSIVLVESNVLNDNKPHIQIEAYLLNPILSNWIGCIVFQHRRIEEDGIYVKKTTLQKVFNSYQTKNSSPIWTEITALYSHYNIPYRHVGTRLMQTASEHARSSFPNHPPVIVLLADGRLSAPIFYYKLGMRSLSQPTNADIETGIMKGFKRGYWLFLETPMFYPEKARAALLKQIKQTPILFSMRQANIKPEQEEKTPSK